MVRVLPVNLPYNIKTLWFDPGDLDIHSADDVVVSTARGTEIGRAAGDIFEVDEEALGNLKSPLKPVLRLANEGDLARAKEMEQRGREAMPVFKELARENNEDMHPVSVEYLLEGDKAIFYFEAEERIDFRELVRKLASHFHVRVDMRQIGVRDEARIVGGLGHCGQIVCCKTMGGEFKPVSIRMAKDQDLSLNPQKISGLCGRLMCCLRYEDEAYKDFKARAPKVGSFVETPDGKAKVESLDIPREEVKLRVEDEKPINVPLECFDAPQEGKRPTSIDAHGWDLAHEVNAPHLIVPSEIFSTSQFTGRDKLGSAQAVHHGKPKRGGDALEKKSPSKRRRSKKRNSADQSGEQTTQKRRQVKRRSTKISGGAQSSEQGAKKREQMGEAGTSHKLRPGHKSSGLAHDDAPAAKRNKKRSSQRKPKGQKDAAGKMEKNHGSENNAGASTNAGASSGEKKQGGRKLRRSRNVKNAKKSEGAPSDGSSPKTR